jgi:uncharacterized protein (TIGR03905 family)
MQYSYQTWGVCSVQILFDLDDDVVSNVVFIGGCNGNLKAIAKLVEGMTVSQIEGYLKGNTCGSKPTSCADQLARAVRKAYDQSHAE